MKFEGCPDVRVATPADANAIFDLMTLAHEENAEHDLSEAKVKFRIDLAVNRRGCLMGVIGDCGGPLKGYVYLILDEIWYSNAAQILELSNFVHPDHRRSTYAKQLIDFAKKCSDGLGIDLTIGVFSNSRTEAKIRLYQRQVKPVGAFFCHKPDRSAAN